MQHKAGSWWHQHRTVPMSWLGYRPRRVDDDILRAKALLRDLGDLALPNFACELLQSTPSSILLLLQYRRCQILHKLSLGALDADAHACTNIAHDSTPSRRLGYLQPLNATKLYVCMCLGLQCSTSFTRGAASDSYRRYSIYRIKQRNVTGDGPRDQTDMQLRGGARRCSSRKAAQLSHSSHRTLTCPLHIAILVFLTEFLTWMSF